jgi:hypothetical protein
MRNNVFLVTMAATALCIFFAPAANAQPPSPDTYVKCNFRPQGDDCESLWRKGGNSDPAAESVKGAYLSYGRYLRAPAAALTDEDRRYLIGNDIKLPDDLSSADLSGLHYVINDPALGKDEAAWRRAVNGFITRAVEAELYCGFNGCGA